MPDGQIPAKTLDPIGSILIHLPAVALIIAIILSSGITAANILIKPDYYTKAVIRIEPVIPKILYGKEEASIMPYYDDFVRTQVNIAKSPAVMREAIRLYEEQDLVWQIPGEDIDDAAARLGAAIDINQTRDTQLVNISMYSRRPEGLAKLVNAVVDAYFFQIKKEQLAREATLLEYLKLRKKQKQEELSQKYADLRKISATQQIGITEKNHIYVYLQAITDLTQNLVKSQKHRIEAETRLAELHNQLDKLAVLDITADVNEWVENDWAMRDNRIQLSRKLQDIRTTLTGVNPYHPDRQEYEETLKRLLEVQDELYIRAQQAGDKIIRGKLISDQNRKILELETEYAAALNAEKRLQAELKLAEQKVTDVNTQLMKAATLRQEIDRLQKSLVRIDQRIDQIEVESRSPGRIHLISRARVPQCPSGDKKQKMMILALLMSLLSGIGYAVVRERLDKSVKTPRDIQRILGFPPTGIILEAAQDTEYIDNISSVCRDNPHSQTAEQFREITYSLVQEHERHGSKVYCALSPGSGHGSSTTILNILTSLKSARKLLLDANIWNPTARRLDIAPRLNMMDIINGECLLDDALTKAPDFSHLSAGDITTADHNSITRFLDTCRDKFDYIFIDAPPLFLRTEARQLAGFCDVAILVGQAERLQEQELWRAADQLSRMGVEVISVILNRVKFQRGRYLNHQVKHYYNLIHDEDNRKDLS